MLEDLDVESLVALKSQLPEGPARERVELVLRKKRQAYWADEPSPVHVLPLTPRAQPRTWTDPHWRTRRKNTKGRAYSLYLENLRLAIQQRGIRVKPGGSVRVICNVPIKTSAHKEVKERMAGRPVHMVLDEKPAYAIPLAQALGITTDRLELSVLWAEKGSVIIEVLQ